MHFYICQAPHRKKRLEPLLGLKYNSVDIKDNTLNRLKDYLSRFWQYYQARPILQEIINNQYNLVTVGSHSEN